ncbi:MAG: SOS response-associated peptidase family protein, partial [Bacteroidota bacterium]
FYEWRKSGVGKLPYRILRTNAELLVMAGLWEEWRDANQVLRTYTIITTGPNEEMSTIHNRMPVLLLNATDRDYWLSDAPVEDLLSLLQTPPDGCLQRYRVSRSLNSVSNNDPKLHEAVNDEPLTLF